MIWVHQNQLVKLLIWNILVLILRSWIKCESAYWDVDWVLRRLLIFTTTPRGLKLEPRCGHFHPLIIGVLMVLGIPVYTSYDPVVSSFSRLLLFLFFFVLHNTNKPSIVIFFSFWKLEVNFSWKINLNGAANWYRA